MGYLLYHPNSFNYCLKCLAEYKSLPPPTQELMKWLDILVLFCLFGRPVLCLQPNSYYTGYSTTQTSSCPFATCPLCTQTGQYRSGCGNTADPNMVNNQFNVAQLTSEGVCAACDPIASNGVITGPGVYTSTSCDFACNAGYQKSGYSCVASDCPALTVPNAYYIETKTPCNWKCNAGYYRELGTATFCTVCPVGKFSQAGVSVCSNCAAGSYAGTTGKQACDSCNVGSYSSTGQSACTPCAAGNYASSLGSTVCSGCNAGTYMMSTGASACVSCIPGKYTASTSLSVACGDCPAGKYAGSSGSTVCADCTGYTFSGTGASACSSCQLCTSNGQYRDGCGGANPGTCNYCSN